MVGGYTFLQVQAGNGAADGLSLCVNNSNSLYPTRMTLILDLNSVSWLVFKLLVLSLCFAKRFHESGDL